MFMNERLSNEQISTYFERICLHSYGHTSLDFLNELLVAHLTHIPFDSIDVWGSGICPSLDVQDIFNKIIIHKRGGYCFEQNTLFRVLLNSLGFDAYQVVACILNEDGSAQPPAHNVIICRLEDKKYLLDVGYGGPVPFSALELVPGENGMFSLAFSNEYYVLYRKESDVMCPFICFRDIPATINDLIPLNFYISQKPDSHFRHILHLNQRNPDGSIYVINGNELKIHRDGHTELTIIRDVDELKRILVMYYNIDPSTCLLRDSI